MNSRPRSPSRHPAGFHSGLRSRGGSAPASRSPARTEGPPPRAPWGATPSARQLPEGSAAAAARWPGRCASWAVNRAQTSSFELGKPRPRRGAGLACPAPPRAPCPFLSHPPCRGSGRTGGETGGGGGRDECVRPQGPRPAPGVTAVGLPGRPRTLLPGPLAGPGWRWGDAAASQPPGSGGRAGTSLPGCGSHLTQSRGTRGSISPNLGYSWKSILFKSAGGLIYRMALRILLTYKHFKNTLRFFPSSPALFLK